MNVSFVHHLYHTQWSICTFTLRWTTAVCTIRKSSRYLKQHQLWSQHLYSRTLLLTKQTRCILHVCILLAFWDCSYLGFFLVISLYLFTVFFPLFVCLLQNGMTPILVACWSGENCNQAAMTLVTHGARVDGLPNVCFYQAVLCCACSIDDFCACLSILYRLMINH